MIQILLPCVTACGGHHPSFTAWKYLNVKTGPCFLTHPLGITGHVALHHPMARMISSLHGILV